MESDDYVFFALERKSSVFRFVATKHKSLLAQNHVHAKIRFIKKVIKLRSIARYEL